MALYLGFVCAGVGGVLAVACSGTSADPPPDPPDFDSGHRDSSAAIDSAISIDPTDADLGPICTAVPCAIQLALGGRHSCALLVDGTVRCWGLNVK
ncbi:MAG: RCC1 domain-containing protein, partial [Polyangiaceae bacterium]